MSEKCEAVRGCAFAAGHTGFHEIPASPDPNAAELARLDAIVAELRAKLARHAAVTTAAQAWRDGGCSDGRDLYALVHAIDALTPEPA